MSGFLTAIDGVPFHFGQTETDALRLFDDPHMAGIGHFAEGRQADEKQILAVAERRADRSARFIKIGQHGFSFEIGRNFCGYDGALFVSLNSINLYRLVYVCIGSCHRAINAAMHSAGSR